MKTKLIKIPIVCIVILSLGALTFAVDELTVLMQNPAKVSTKYIEGDIPNHYQFELLIERGSSHFKFMTDIRSDSFNEALKHLRNSVRWNDSYLFVSWERGGGNASRSYLDTVFILKEGKLLYLGEVDADSLENGGFKDWYDKFEGNELTSHAESPLIRLLLEKKGERLVVNLEKTWTENQKGFTENKEIIKYIQAKEKMKSESRVTQIVGPLVFNAVLGKYCKHEEDMNSFVEIAKKELDQERLKLFKAILARVKPGELPKAAVELQKY